MKSESSNKLENQPLTYMMQPKKRWLHWEISYSKMGRWPIKTIQNDELSLPLMDSKE